MWSALAARIRFTRMYYLALLLITKKDSQSGADCVALLNGCSEMMKVIIRTSGKGTQPEENCKFFKLFLLTTSKITMIK